MQHVAVNLESSALSAFDPEDVRVDEPANHHSPLTARADPQLLAKQRAQLTRCTVTRPVLWNLDGERRKPRIRPAVLEIDRPRTIRQIVDVDDADRVHDIERSEDVGGKGTQLQCVHRNHRRPLLSPWRTVTKVRSRYSSSGTTIRRLLPRNCRTSLTVAGPFFVTKALTFAVASATAAAFMTRSPLMSTTSPLSTRNFNARWDAGSGVSSLRDGGSSGWADRMWRSRSPAARSGSGSCARCDARWMTVPERENSLSHSRATSASNT